MNDLLTCAVLNLETADLVKLFQEFSSRKKQAAADRRPGQPILFSVIADYLAAEIKRRYNDENEKRAILEAAG